MKGRQRGSPERWAGHRPEGRVREEESGERPGPLRGSWREWLTGRVDSLASRGRCLAGNGGRGVGQGHSGGEMYFCTWEGIPFLPQAMPGAVHHPISFNPQNPHGRRQ